MFVILPEFSVFPDARKPQGPPRIPQGEKAARPALVGGIRQVPLGRSLKENHFRKHPKTKKRKPTFSFGRSDLEENLRGVCVTQSRAALLTLDGPCFFCRTPSRPCAFIRVRASFPEIIGQNSKRKSSCAWITRVFFPATLTKVSKAIRCKVGEALHGCAADLVSVTIMSNGRSQCNYLHQSYFKPAVDCFPAYWTEVNTVLA